MITGIQFQYLQFKFLYPLMIIMKQMQIDEPNDNSDNSDAKFCSTLVVLPKLYLDTYLRRSLIRIFYVKLRNLYK